MASPNQINSRAGKYRCTDCGYEVTVNKGGKFPRCPVHPHPAAWFIVRQVAPKGVPAKR
jgi:transposase-like protein